MDPKGLLLSTVDIASPWDAPPAAPFLVLALGPGPKTRVAPSYCPLCGNQMKDYSAEEAQRRHLNALLSEAYLRLTVPPRPVQDKITDGKKIEVPWARIGTEFTQLFEALVMSLIRQIPVRVAAALLDAGDSRLWRSLDREACQEVNWGSAAGCPVTEGRSGSKGRDYLNLFYDLDVSFEVTAKEGTTTAELKTAPGVKPPTAASLPCAISRTLILAAIIARARGALAAARFRYVSNRHDALGMVRAEAGMLYPGRSRAPPGRLGWSGERLRLSSRSERLLRRRRRNGYRPRSTGVRRHAAQFGSLIPGPESARRSY